MNHHISPLYSGFPFWPLLVMAIVAAFIVVLGLLRRYLVGPGGLSSSEKKTLEAGEAEILAMLRQTGGNIPQPELSEKVPLSPSDVAESLYKLERRELVERRWDTETKAYLVHAR